MTRPADHGPRTVREAGETWLQVREAARQLGVTSARIYHLVDDGRLRHRTQQGLLYVRARDVKRYLKYQHQLNHLRTKLTPL